MTRTISDVKVDRTVAELRHEQVAAQIRRAIADGEANPANGYRWPRTSPRSSA
jgi:hypothetical protein